MTRHYSKNEYNDNIGVQLHVGDSYEIPDEDPDPDVFGNYHGGHTATVVCVSPSSTIVRVKCTCGDEWEFHNTKDAW